MSSDRINPAVLQSAQANNIKTKSNDELLAELGLDIPQETVPIPSRGVIYSPDNALHMCETVDIRPMTTREEDILTSRALLKKGTVINELIKSCLVDKRIDVNSMLSGDKTALMFAVRITGYGADYSAEITCNECSEKFDYTFDLAQLGLKRLMIEPVTQGVNEFKFTLPVTKRDVMFKFLTGYDEDNISKTQEAAKKLGSRIDSNVTTKLVSCVTSIAGVQAGHHTISFIKNMPARDSLALREFIDSNEPGVDTKQNCMCSKCGADQEVSIPIGINFLWPSARK